MLDPRWQILATVALVLCVRAMTVQAETPLGTAFTYQGQLKHDGVVVTDVCEFEFALWDEASNGLQKGTTQTKPAVGVRDGLFTLQLDFGSSAFNGSARWLAMSVKCSDDLSFVSFDPRQPITGTPYALQTRGMFVDDDGNVGVGTTNPTARLDVSGTLKIGDDKLSCDGTREGSVRYNSATKILECCDGSSWKEVGGRSTPTGAVMFYDPSPC